MALRKNRTRFTVGLAVGIMMVVGLLGPIAPALAGHGAGTANVDIHEILAGTPSQAFRITVTHPAGDTQNLPDSITNPQPAPPAVNWVQVTTPPGFQASATSTSGPHSGWSVSVLPLGSEAGRRVIFSLTSGNGIAASGSGVFTINSAVPRPAAEVTGPTANWQVRSSSDGGESFVLPTGDLSTRVRVLKIDDVALTSPAGVVDHSVTGNQGKRRDVDSDGTPDEADVLATCVVTNHASVAHVITPTLGGGSNVNIEEGAGQAATVASRAQHTFTYRVSFADVSTTQSPALQCNANSVRADGGAGIGTTPTGFNLQKTITIQPKAVFTYNSVPTLPSFSPNALSPNSDNVTFRVAIQKSGVPAVALDPARTTLAFKNNAGEVKIPPIRLSSTPAVPAGNVSNFVLEFGPVNLASLGLTDGRLTGELNIRGMDANDAVVAFLPVPSFAEKLLIDAGIPTLDLNITPPNLPTGWPTDPDFNLVVRAARNGQTVSFGGKVEDTNPDTTQQEGCGTCTILSSHLVPYSQENGGEAGTPIPVTLNINPSTGAITGSYTLAAGAIGSAKSLVLRAQVRDAAGNVSALTTSVGCPWCNPTWSTEVRDQLSGRSIIDNTTPLIVSAKTRRRATGEQNLLEVTLSECVNGTTTARDWTLSGSTNRVVAVENAAGRPSCKVSSQVPYSSSATVLLRTANEFPDDSTAGNDLPSLSYDPGATVPHPLDPTTSAGTRFIDRTGAQVANQTLDLIDGIAPLGPVLQSIQVGAKGPFGLQDGAFWTNIDKPKFLLVNPPKPTQAVEVPDDRPYNRSISQGYTVELYQETNGQSGLQRGGDTKLGEKVVQASDCTGTNGQCSALVEADFTVAGADASDTSEDDEAAHRIYAVSLDFATPKNVSDAATSLVEIDRIAPQVNLNEFVFNPTDVEVKFVEPIARGRNGAADWAFANDLDQEIMVTQVTGSGASRTLKVGGSEYDKDRIMLAGYQFLGPAANRYEDRATNTLSDFFHCLTRRAGSSVCPA